MMEREVVMKVARHRLRGGEAGQAVDEPKDAGFKLGIRERPREDMFGPPIERGQVVMLPVRPLEQLPRDFLRSFFH